VQSIDYINQFDDSVQRDIINIHKDQIDGTYFDDDDIVDEVKNFPELKTKLSLSWHNVKIRAEPKERLCRKKKGISPQTKVIIDNISGSAHPGEFISIIGASGAGKTTLLNYLSGRLISKNLTKEGVIKLNG
jgi:ABC-type bacteriocin/lantibiotic exporter with double-glycine peptidase domain